MEEDVDILDEHGNYTGEIRLKSDAHELGLFHPTVHIWFYTRKGELLFQKRAATKKTFPSLWDVSVAGHVSAGESIEDSAIREVKEEIGLNISVTEIVKVAVFKSVHHHANGIVDAEFNHCFLAELKAGLKDLKIEEDEVEEVQLIPISELQYRIQTFGMEGMVPISNAYWETLFLHLNALLH